MENVPAGTEKTEIEGELPPEVERRLVLRLLGYWRPLCEDREFSSLSDVDPAQIPDMWPHCFVLDVVGDAGTLGKTPGKDAAHSKPTVVAALGLEGARAEARERADEARAGARALGLADDHLALAWVERLAARRA